MTEPHLVTFSPTSTSRKIGEAIAKGFGTENVVMNDLTHDPNAHIKLGPDHIAIITVPVYGGHVAPTAIQRMQSMQGQNTPAVIVVVYGNRHYEQALDELNAFVSERGFRVIAAGTFIGEHSYSTAQTPLAQGRPDAADLECANLFGSAVCKKLSLQPHAEAIDTRAIEAPGHSPDAMRQFKQTVMGWMQQGMQFPSTPSADNSLCNGCGTCAELCPSTAITAENPTETDASACIKCCACVKGCPTGARSFATPFAPLLAQHFSERQKNRTLV